MVGLNIITEDETDNTFKKFSILKDHDIRYDHPSQLRSNNIEYKKGDVFSIGGKNRECESGKTSS